MADTKLERGLWERRKAMRELIEAIVKAVANGMKNVSNKLK